jgi:hypothetical protein
MGSMVHSLMGQMGKGIEKVKKEIMLVTPFCEVRRMQGA